MGPQKLQKLIQNMFFIGWDNYSNLIGLPDFLEFSFGGGFSGQEWFQWVRDLSFHRRSVN